ncbi:hypothetical protein PsorP6_007313 [Peronosclerospora sorghi]|uniref:Uncharacterized protein n=1 Tax=Peronosclerospora sorghi TaxID=230839 RepID=A0ACC0WDE2_9STRA|nr:hypothetical protein PsorP6_007313 [Peronosclerospora sorghi]
MKKLGQFAWTDETVDGYGHVLASGAMDGDDDADGNSVGTRNVERSGGCLGRGGTAGARRLSGARRSARLRWKKVIETSREEDRFGRAESASAARDDGEDMGLVPLTT